MQNRKQLETSIKLILAFKGLATAYEEISVTKMQRVRGKVLQARDYLSEISDVYETVKSSYRKEILSMMNSKKQNETLAFSTMQKNGKSISILISSNNKLYGDIGRKVFHVFRDYIHAHSSDVYIVGRVGKEYFDQSGETLSYEYLDFPEGGESEGMEKILNLIEEYEHVNVFYGQFVNVLTQNANISSLTGAQDLEKEVIDVDRKNFYFEPSLEEVLEFFENQIVSSLFKQTLHESELSHTASRIRQMETALENIDDSQQKLMRNKRKLQKRMDDMKQIQRVAGMRMWRRG